ncbi:MULTISPECIES: hypothetical protein [Vibrio harveyi group]|uniref:hypothetical protein n=1 Tax=Vibrio harveyi group TaxID=717610 RepID=UPI001AD80858|nr:MULTISPECIES: hypothetical protein [Vibrio harveyi group]ELB2829391.1 hypothetical protein [Vibrio alginolyticus]MBS9911980.1 hypothetical protein [Vibrio alginolyticus]MBT0049790.1 hypothetical protein [Vibrio alginolyticus]MBT0063598.1 hypothetical protein [Vibrio alginolyticus]MCR9778393.1 hypothetical protein [Vibrio parahaemolyticus]
MANATFQTELGAVTAKGPYFSFIQGREVVQLTFIKPENEANGYGVCKEFPSDISLSPEFMSNFAEQSVDLL